MAVSAEAIYEDLGEGVGIAIGGTHFRQALCNEEGIRDFHDEPTGNGPHTFFHSIARGLYAAAKRDVNWGMVGFPGPVEDTGDGFQVGPFANIPSLNILEPPTPDEPRVIKTYDLLDELSWVHSGLARELDNGFEVVASNDGPLDAQAIAHHFNILGHRRVAAVILGTGNGGDMVVASKQEPKVYFSLDAPIEVGHAVANDDLNITDTNETRYAGSGIAVQTGIDPETLPYGHPYWRQVGRGLGRIIQNLAVYLGPQTVGVVGGVGIGAQDNYMTGLEEFWRQHDADANAPQRKFRPHIVIPPVEYVDTIELHGIYHAMAARRYAAANSL